MLTLNYLSSKLLQDKDLKVIKTKIKVNVLKECRLGLAQIVFEY